MKTRWMTVLLLFAVVGCESGRHKASFPPLPVTPLPPDSSQLEPGPQDPDAPKEFTTTASGLKYRILRKSEGTKPTAKSSVRVHYEGKLDDGKVFDKSYGKSGRAIEFQLSGVVRGWTEGLQLIGEGGMIELEIPPELGYGVNGHPPAIPANATLHFIVELLEVRNSP